MQIIYHLGAHSTDDDQLLQSLIKNYKALVSQGVYVPRPWRYRTIMRETIQALSGDEASQDVQDVVLTTANVGDEARRVILAHENFISIPRRAISEDPFYPNAADKTQWLRRVFPDDEVQFFIAMRDPATFFPAMAARVKDVSAEEMLAACDPARQRWSEMIGRIRAANPDAAITTWCNEDTPLIWRELMAAMSGMDDGFEFMGQYDLANTLLTEEGQRRMAAYVAAHPPANKSQRHRVLAAFLEKFGKEGALEEEVEMPGWTDDYVRALTEAYEADLHAVAAIPGVTLITP